ncbi:16S rRNA (uracil(1498)-N(3))-methyltransferase [candidate division KSB3 bacterium]|uniref:Ribosomal RNA small subunit methyltransferase E n=1 Tax=candidate division KSB3 bacterium TaxID=2044937 RepID=A0A9D5JYJ0_9BACT|nr:16S rRNA (uracil(1498)-N(3))-methyltransferase [candidate division KSB3 bacterium]MBD3326584.1 16S rRNA (uracil(1498)-N(3))-methyltransferase [candidate division KSB3 bacterium]
MSIPRFYVPPTQINADRVCIRGADVWHITKVLRLAQGAEVIVFDGKGWEYRVVLGKPKRREIVATIVDRWEQQTESPLHLTLVQGIPKASKMDLIVQKATELGVNEVIPLHAERSEWKLTSSQKVHQRLDRWSRIGIEAAKQSRRTAVPLIRPVLTVQEFLTHPPEADVKLILWEEERQRSLKQALQAYPSLVRSAVVIIGPEGGLTRQEVEQFQVQAYMAASLGPRILRTETASIVVLGILQYTYGDEP